MLAQIIKAKKNRLKALDRRAWESKLDSMLSDIPRNISFREAIAGKQELTLIAEFKRKAPSAGILNMKADPVEQAKRYKEGGASALSVLTEEDFFGGRLDDISSIKSEVDMSVLRKDFILDPLQIKEARAFGADAVLLLVGILEPGQLRLLMDKARFLQLDCICEVNSESEIRIALDGGAEIIGINNRNLETFEIDLNTTRDLRKKIPLEIIVISESGIRTAADARFVRSCGVDAILVGTELMRTKDVTRKLAELLI